jgi:hypothetical protein
VDRLEGCDAVICPKCGQDTSANKSFCNHCGGFLALGTAEVQASLEAEVISEAQARSVRRAGTWLATSIVLLAAAMLFRLSFREKDLPRFDESPLIPLLQMESPRLPPAPEMPMLTLPVPS